MCCWPLVQYDRFHGSEIGDRETCRTRRYRLVIGRTGDGATAPRVCPRPYPPRATARPCMSRHPPSTAVQWCQAGEQPRIGDEGHASRFTRTQGNALEREKPHSAAIGSANEIELRHIGACRSAGVHHGEVRRDRGVTRGAGDEVFVRKSRVAQTVAEREERLLLHLREPSIPDFGALVYQKAVGVPAGTSLPANR